MSRDLFENGEVVTDGKGNKGQIFRFWYEREKRHYFRVRLIEGPLRSAGKMWVSVLGWRGLVDYGGTIDQRCCKCGRDFRSPLPLAPGEEFCKVCAGGEELAVWLKDYGARLKAWTEQRTGA